MALIATELQELPPPLAPGITASSLRTIANSTISDLQAGRRTTRHRAAPTDPRVAARTERIKKDAAKHKCFHYNQKGHTQDNCPKPTTPSSLATADKRKDAYFAARDIRDKERAVAGEAERIRRIALDLTLEDSEESDAEEDDDVVTPVRTTPKKDKRYFLSSLSCPIPSQAIAMKPCLRSTKMLTKHSTVIFYNDPHADSIFVSPSTSIDSSVSTNFFHVGSRFKETKPIPSSEHIFIIYIPTSFKYHFEQLRVDVHQNRLTKRKERKTMPRWPLTYDTTTEKHTLTHQNNKTLSQRLADTYHFITLAAEDDTFRAITLTERLHVIFPGAVLDTGATKHAGADVSVILKYLHKYFLMHPAIGPPVQMPAVMLGATTVTHDGTECRFPLPGAGVFDASMKETLISVAKL